MALTDHDIMRATGDNSFRRGAAYQAQGKVKSVSLDARGRVSAIVQGSYANRYRQEIALANSNGRISIEGECSCPLGRNCKHVAAALLEARRRGLFVEDRSPERGSAGQTGMPRLQAAPSKPVERPVELSPEIARWLSDLEKSTFVPNEDFANDAGQRLFYILDQSPFGIHGRTETLALHLRSARLSKSGTLSPTVSEFQPSTVYQAKPPKYLLAEDHRIIREALRQSAQISGRLNLVLSGEEGAGLLLAILATGRARWKSVEGPPLSAGPERRGTLAWIPGDATTLVPSLRLEEGHGDHSPDQILLAAHPPVYVDPTAGIVGPVETGLAPRVVHRILSAPPLPMDQARLVSARLETAGGALSRISRPTLEQVRIVREKPVPILRLRRDVVPDPLKDWGVHYYGYLKPLDLEVGRAELSFLYAGVEIAAGEPDQVTMRLKGLQPFEIHRQPKAEKAAIGRLADMGFSPFAKLYPTTKIKGAKPLGFAGSAEWCQFVYADAPTLRQEGWVIDIAADFPFQVVRGDGVFEAKVRESSGIDWFEFDLAILVDGERIDLVEPLVTAILKVDDIGEMVTALAAEDGTLSLRLDAQRFLTLPAAKLKPYIDTLLQLLSGFAFEGNAPKQLRFSALDAAHLAVLENATDGAGAVWQGGDGVRALGARLKEAGRIPDVALPSIFKAELRPYQARGVAWLDFLRSASLGGILADDMGLGKTIQALALIALEKAAGRLTTPALVIAPTSLMVNWSREAARFAPDLKVLVLQGLDRKTKFGEIDGADLVLSTYPLVQRDHGVLNEREWHLLILDEAQTIKNPAATTTKLIGTLKACHRFCLTGTPLENHLGELWSLFHFIAPGFLGDAKAFAKIWRTPIEKQGDTALARALAARVKPFLLRRRKDEVASDLPPKTVIVERVEFGTGQAEIYESIRLAMHSKVFAALAEKGLARSRIVILEALLKLRQACCDPRLLKLGGKAAEKAGSAKLERLMEMVDELLAEGRHILIFSQFTSMLALIRARLDEKAITYALLTGDTKDRAAEVNAFQDGRVPVFLVSLKAGGVGLNLTAADTVILYDPWWNPAVENQAIDRAHRIGQDKPVFVHKLVASETIEEKIEVLKERKAALAAGLFDPEGAPAEAMTEDDLKGLFEI